MPAARSLGRVEARAKSKAAGAAHARGIALLEQGRAADAATALMRAVQLAPASPGYLANLSEAHRRAGNPAAGAECARRALALSPDHHIALVNLGCCLFDAGDHAGALEVFTRAVAAVPGDAPSIAYRADALRELGQVRAAIEGYRRAIEIAPDSAHAHANLGLVLLATGRTDEALACCDRAVELAPDDHVPLQNRGRCLFELEQFDEAMDSYAEAYERMPDSPTICSNIGKVWEECGDAVQALLWYEKALLLDPASVATRVAIAALKIDQGLPADAIVDLEAIIADHADAFEAHVALARAHWDDGDAREAVAHYGRATALRPEFASLWASMGQVLASSGDIPAAIDHYRRALAINPNCVGALHGLATTRGACLEPEWVARIETLLGDPRLREGLKSLLHNALAHYFDGAGDYRAAGRNATAANLLQRAHRERRHRGYDPERHARHIDRIIAMFDADYFAEVEGFGLDDDAPVFVVGMPRSGTTLTEQILASHPRVLGLGERPFAMRTYNAVIGDAESGTTALPDGAEVSGAARWHRERLAALAEKARRHDQSVTRIVDKLPDNYQMLGWIVTLFPRARIIHCRRDMRDVAVSCWITQFAQIDWACDPAHIASRIHDYRRVIAHWRRVLPVPMLEIDYESLVADTEGVSRQLIAWLGLDWDPRCLEFHRNERLVRTASVTQVRQPVYSRSVARWRRYEDELATLFAAIGMPEVQ